MNRNYVFLLFIPSCVSVLIEAIFGPNVSLIINEKGAPGSLKHAVEELLHALAKERVALIDEGMRLTGIAEAFHLFV